MNRLSPSQIGGLVRSFMAFLGGIGITLGYFDETQWLEISGAVVTLAVVGWSLYSNTVVSQTKAVASSPDVKSIVASSELAYASNNAKVTSHP